MGGEMYSVLVVDDQPGLRRLLYEALTDVCPCVLAAAGGREALAMIDRHRPAIVLLDLKMPGLDGVDTLRLLRERYPDMVVVVMTAYSELETLKSIKELGVSHYLAKPFDIHEVRYLVKALLAKVDKKNCDWRERAGGA